LARFISTVANSPGNIIELQSAFKRVLQAGLANLPEDGFDEESLDVDRPGSPAETIELLHPSDPRAVDFRTNLRTWFGKAPWSSIKKHEMSMWIYWSIFNSAMPSPDKMPQTHRNAVDDALENIEKRSGCRIPEGSNPSVKPVLLTLDPVNVSFRPFFWYIFVAVANLIVRARLQRQHNVKFGIYQNLEYFVRIPDNWDPSNPHTRPIVFIHGLGLGLLQYAMFFNRIMTTFPDRPLLVPVQPHISQNIFSPRFVSPMSRYETVGALVGLLRLLGWAADDNDNDTMKPEASSGVTMLSHSNGSFTHAWFLKSHPELVTRSCLVDPVTFCSWEGDVCYNFVYKRCVNAMDLIMYYFVGSELGVANFLQRHFDWASNALWYEEIPNARNPSKSMFVLGGQDSIIRSERVLKYLRSHGVRKGILYTPEHHHGEALLPHTEAYGQIIEWLRE